MEFKNLFSDDRAVSPVIGVILMVAITVILAAVIGTFVLGLGDQIQSTSPQASFGFDTTEVEISNAGSGETDVLAVTVTHESGDSIDASDLRVTVDGKQAYTEGSDDAVGDSFTDTVSAGSTITIMAASNADVEIGDEYQYDDGTDDELDINLDGDTDFDDSAEDPQGAVNGAELSSGETVRVIFDSPDSDSSSTLAKFQIP